MKDPKFVESKLKIKASPQLQEEVQAELKKEKEEKSIASLISESGVFREGNNETSR
jgi:hypothetical protein